MRTVRLYIFSLLACTACTPDPDHFTDKNPLIRDALERRRLQYADEVMDNCRREAVRKADAYVDSLIAAQIQVRVSDSIIFPEKPMKPLYPGPVTLSDTLRARPLK